ncbi:MAG TPA: poly-gamma-glutamate biosynthesis protein PgsC [Myxococcota bacterium]|nr:poly-gamma-glutamate biosynthesis protein PgsC [Myxococcota bacterium]HOA14063.1 poly-gamma-glutamate biosynthesis protein PgsC [Myxococcota bacterium]HOC99116.1 poly-gamma-glutamate biosynthesis protein PgsC [Myxococcota bacterium]HOH77264.1 poly-gamma-glutamate biosynthesis protein PgsC [Myxococcota bacterium]HPV03042.1 poly-gamma-glutamate biosynthesis protein PgsC [Myxococcota bacterium]
MISEILPVSIGVGIVTGVLFSEAFGIATGGIVVPGYLALFVNQPLVIALTVAAGFLTYVVVKALSMYLIIFGRRRTAVMILFGYVVGVLLNRFIGNQVGEFAVIGYIIPGLIALWMDRQGTVQTLASLTIVTVIVRMVLIVTGFIDKGASL